jgi:hypothetical protein
MSKNKLAIKDLQKIEGNLTGILETDVLPPELMKMLEDKMPEWMKEYEADGTAVARWMHEYLILMEEVLRIDFDFKEEDMIKLEKRIKETLPVLHKMKIENTKLLRKADMAIGMDMVDRNKALFKAERAGITLPSGDLKKIK